MSLIALAVALSQFFINRAERKRVMPTVAMHAMYTDKMYIGGINEFRTVVSIQLENRGREDTTVTGLAVCSSDRTIVVDGFSSLLDPATGERAKPDATNERLPGFTTRGYYVDASMMEGTEVVVEARLGHGEEIHVHATRNHLSGDKRISGRKAQQLVDKWF